MKNFYAILGLTLEAEEIVIKAAYKALAQKYHPDKNLEDSSNAADRMREINEAYAVLSDKEKKLKYDQGLSEMNFGNKFYGESEEAAKDGCDQTIDDWLVATEYFPDLLEIEKRLTTISRSLAFTYRLRLINEKSFKDKDKIAQEMEFAFLKRFFGENISIIKFAKAIILEGKRDAAKALNEAVRVLGDQVSPSVIIGKITSKYEILGYDLRQSSGLKVKAGITKFGREGMEVGLAMRSGANAMVVRNAIIALNGNVRFVDQGAVVDVLGFHKKFKDISEMINWFQKQLYPALVFISD